MKRFVGKIHSLGQKAAQVKEAIGRAPAHAADIREAVMATAGQLQSLRLDVQDTLVSLRSGDGKRLVEALHELDANAGLFREVGFELADVELEVGRMERLTVHLDRVEHVPLTQIRALLQQQETSGATGAILSALLKGRERLEEIHLANLSHERITVEIGPAPAIRLCWRSPLREQTEEVSATEPAAAFPPPLPTTPSFGQGSFFERRETPPAAPTVPHATDPAPPPASVPTAPTGEPVSPAAQPAPSGNWRASALDRFKKMPDLSRRNP